LPASGLVHYERPEFAKIKAIKSEPTPKEEEIINALADGLSYKLIADKMSISINTVRFHIKNIYRKLRVHSKAEVIRKSLKDEI
jgi:DNA-binding CsgD family transcriptional regulator